MHASALTQVRQEQSFGLALGNICDQVCALESMLGCRISLAQLAAELLSIQCLMPDDSVVIGESDFESFAGPCVELRRRPMQRLGIHPVMADLYQESVLSAADVAASSCGYVQDLIICSGQQHGIDM